MQLAATTGRRLLEDTALTQKGSAVAERALRHHKRISRDEMMEGGVYRRVEMEANSRYLEQWPKVLLRALAEYVDRRAAHLA